VISFLIFKEREKLSKVLFRILGPSKNIHQVTLALKSLKMKANVITIITNQATGFLYKLETKIYLLIY
jgi:hypothetical protein